MSIYSSASSYPYVANKLYLITGATGGIGSKCALLLAHLGAKVVLSGRNPEQLEKLASSLPESSYIIMQGDLEKIDTNEWLEELTTKADMPLSGVAYCAGINNLAPLRGFNKKRLMADFEDFTVRAASIFYGVTRLTSRTHECSLVAMSSISAHQAKPGNAFYGAARAAMESLCRSFAVEFAPIGIRCNSVCAGFIGGTKMTDHLLELKGKSYLDNIEDRYLLGPGKPEDAANALVFLLGSASSWITGITLLVDGGYSIKGI